MVGEILKLCKEKGFFLDKETLRLLSELDKNKAYEIIEKISRLKLKERVITQELYKRYINSPKDLLNNDNLIDEKIGEANGSIALQIHSGGGIKVRWKDILIREL